MTTDRGKRECVSWIVREQGGGDIREFRAYIHTMEPRSPITGVDNMFHNL